MTTRRTATQRHRSGVLAEAPRKTPHRQCSPTASLTHDQRGIPPATSLPSRVVIAPNKYRTRTDITRLIREKI
jgi:hypothetical protein